MYWSFELCLQATTSTYLKPGNLYKDSIYFFSVSNTPKDSTYFRPKKIGAMEVTSKIDLILYIIMNAPMYLALSVLKRKLSAKMHWFSDIVAYVIYAILIILYIFQVWKIIQVNKTIFHTKVPEIQRYPFKQITILDLAYALTFGAELAVVFHVTTVLCRFF